MKCTHCVLKEGFARGILGEVSYEPIFEDFNAKPVLNGAMGADRCKAVEGKTIELLGFICIPIPTNPYHRKLRGDSNLFFFTPGDSYYVRTLA